jgi:hypothetical protein
MGNTLYEIPLSQSNIIQDATSEFFLLWLYLKIDILQ